jgi:hypothetical protein
MDRPTTIPPGKEGQILLMGRNGKWHWVMPDAALDYERQMRRFVVRTTIIVVLLLVSALLLCFSAHSARADNMPDGWSCAHARQFAYAIGASMVWDRERTRAIAASYGYALTEAQLNALEKCFKEVRR